MNCDEFRENADALALGALDAAERATALAHLAACEACAAEYRAASRVVERLPLGAPRLQAPAGMRSAVMQAIREGDGSGMGRPTPPAATEPAAPGVVPQVPAALPAVAHGRRPSRGLSVMRARFRMPLLAAAVFAVVVGLGAWTAWLQVQVRDLKHSQYAAQEAAALGAGSPSVLARASADALMLLSSPTTVRAPLGSAAARGPSGAVFWSPDQKRCVVMAQQLPPAPAGHQYHVWFRVGDTTWDGGGLLSDAAGDAEMVIATDRWQLDRGYTITVVLQPEGQDSPRQVVLTGNLQAPVQ